MMISNFSEQYKASNRQGGLALISVLLIFAIVSVLATAMIERQSLDIQRSGNLQALQQARAYSSGIEDAVRSGLH
jgi:general secretion pathway protein K